MSVLSQDYDRLQSVTAPDNPIVQNYKQLFGDGDIYGAQQIAMDNCPQVVMDADRLNDLVDTINYMQQFWMDDKITFENLLLGMMSDLSSYDVSEIYDVGQVVVYNDEPYFCIDRNVTGAFDNTKWLLLKPNEMGFYISDSFGSAQYVSYAEMYSLDGRYLYSNWYDNSGGDYVVRAFTYPNIRYIDEEGGGLESPYAGEIYMTDWDGGEG